MPAATPMRLKKQQNQRAAIEEAVIQEMSEIRVSYSFLPTEQLRGRALKNLGIPISFGAMIDWVRIDPNFTLKLNPRDEYVVPSYQGPRKYFVSRLPRRPEDQFVNIKPKMITATFSMSKVADRTKRRTSKKHEAHEDFRAGDDAVVLSSPGDLSQARSRSVTLGAAGKIRRPPMTTVVPDKAKKMTKTFVQRGRARIPQNEKSVSVGRSGMCRRGSPVVLPGETSGNSTRQDPRHDPGDGQGRRDDSEPLPPQSCAVGSRTDAPVVDIQHTLVGSSPESSSGSSAGAPSATGMADAVNVSGRFCNTEHSSASALEGKGAVKRRSPSLTEKQLPDVAVCAEDLDYSPNYRPAVEVAPISPILSQRRLLVRSSQVSISSDVFSATTLVRSTPPGSYQAPEGNSPGGSDAPALIVPAHEKLQTPCEPEEALPQRAEGESSSKVSIGIEVESVPAGRSDSEDDAMSSKVSNDIEVESVPAGRSDSEDMFSEVSIEVGPTPAGYSKDDALSSKVSVGDVSWISIGDRSRASIGDNSSTSFGNQAHQAPASKRKKLSESEEKVQVSKARPTSTWDVPTPPEFVSLHSEEDETESVSVDCAVASRTNLVHPPTLKPPTWEDSTTPSSSHRTGSRAENPLSPRDSPDVIESSQLASKHKDLETPSPSSEHQSNVSSGRKRREGSSGRSRCSSPGSEGRERLCRDLFPEEAQLQEAQEPASDNEGDALSTKVSVGDLSRTSIDDVSRTSNEDLSRTSTGEGDLSAPSNGDATKITKDDGVEHYVSLHAAAHLAFISRHGVPAEMTSDAGSQSPSGTTSRPTHSSRRSSSSPTPGRRAESARLALASDSDSEESRRAPRSHARRSVGTDSLTVALPTKFDDDRRPSRSVQSPPLFPPPSPSTTNTTTDSSTKHTELWSAAASSEPVSAVQDSDQHTQPPPWTAPASTRMSVSDFSVPVRARVVPAYQTVAAATSEPAEARPLSTPARGRRRSAENRGTPAQDRDSSEGRLPSKRNTPSDGRGSDWLSDLGSDLDLEDAEHSDNEPSAIPLVRAPPSCMTTTTESSSNLTTSEHSKFLSVAASLEPVSAVQDSDHLTQPPPRTAPASTRMSVGDFSVPERARVVPTRQSVAAATSELAEARPLAPPARGRRRSAENSGSSGARHPSKRNTPSEGRDSDSLSDLGSDINLVLEDTDEQDIELTLPHTTPAHPAPTFRLASDRDLYETPRRPLDQHMNPKRIRMSAGDVQWESPSPAPESLVSTLPTSSTISDSVASRDKQDVTVSSHSHASSRMSISEVIVPVLQRSERRERALRTLREAVRHPQPPGSSRGRTADCSDSDRNQGRDEDDKTSCKSLSEIYSPTE